MSTQLQYEIERAFIVEPPPDNYTQFPSKEIEQGYYKDPETQVFTRVRRKGRRYFQTIKTGAGLVRQETETELTQEQFEAVWPLTEGWRLEKVRYEIPFEGHTIELDIYKGALHPFISADVEFDSVESSRAFSPPPWMKKEVTEDVRYTNAQLAKNGLPED